MWIRMGVANVLSSLIGVGLIFNEDYWYLIPLFILQILASLDYKMGGDDK